MTFIEFFDKTSVENLCACLTSPPARMILIGDKIKHLLNHAERYQRVFEERGYSVEIFCKTLNRNNLQGIVSYLSEIVETYENCAFGLTGGDDLFLTAAGIVYERYKHKGIQLHRFNIRNNTVYDCDSDGNSLTVNENTFLSVSENIRIYGGDIIYGDGATVNWEIDADFANDIRKIWDICKKDVKKWNTAINGGDVRSSVFASLERASLLKRDGYRIVYKSDRVKRCLTKAGLALEMIIFIAGIQATDTEGNPIYNDVMNGVCIDWDGKTDNGKYDTKNEIDVMMMHGMQPVFISCKNGSVETEELYKLNSVAEKFGGQYAKKILVATALDKMGESGSYFRQRAKDMNIRIIEGLQDASYEELQKTVNGFWCN